MKVWESSGKGQERVRKGSGKGQERVRKAKGGKQNSRKLRKRKFYKILGKILDHTYKLPG
jgi:hypothetical protein